MFLDQRGVEQLKQEIRKKELELLNAKKEKGESFVNDTNSWHDNFAFEQAKLRVDSLSYDIFKLNEDMKNVKIIEPHNDKGKVDINDVVIFYNYNIEEEEKVFLSAEHTIELEKNGIEVATINSVLGQAIYKKGRGEKASFKVGDRVFNIKIIDFFNVLEDEKE